MERFKNFLLLIISIISLIVPTSLALNGIYTEAQLHKVIAAVWQLKSNVFETNLAIRAAALESNLARIEFELAKMAHCRPSSSHVYDILNTADLFNEALILRDDLKAGRKDYLETQQKVIRAIKNNNIEQVKLELGYYNLLMERYIGRTSNLIAVLEARSNSERIRIIVYVIVALAISLFILGLILRSFYARPN